MARIMSVDGVSIYRMLVTRKDDDGRDWQTAFGPHAWPNNCQTQELAGPTRQEKQQLIAFNAFGIGPALQWANIKVTYTNGGEGVNWDE